VSAPEPSLRLAGLSLWVFGYAYPHKGPQGATRGEGDTGAALFANFPRKSVVAPTARKHPAQVFFTLARRYPLPTNGIFVAITVRNSTLASSGWPAM